MKSYIEGEIKKFSSLANEWWSERGAMRVLHHFNTTRLKFIKLNTMRYSDLNDCRVLDVGCGGGILSESLAKLGFSVTGIDPSTQSIEVAKEHAKKEGLLIDYYNSAPEEFIKQHNRPKFDIVLAMDVIEHVADVEDFTFLINEFTLDGGTIFFSTINKSLRSLLLAKVAAEYILRWLPKGTHEFSRFVEPKVLEEIAEKQNWMLNNIKGISFNILRNSWELTNNTSVNYICCYEKITI